MATRAHTTDPRRRRSTRRALFAGSAALTAAAAGAAAVELWPNDDTPLIAALHRFHACHAEVLRLEATDDHTWEEIEDSGEAWSEAAEALCDLAPSTCAGLAAKAAATMMVLRAGVGDYTRPERFDANAETHDRLAMVQDVLRLAGGEA